MYGNCTPCCSNDDRWIDSSHTVISDSVQIAAIQYAWMRFRPSIEWGECVVYNCMFSRSRSSRVSVVPTYDFRHSDPTIPPGLSLGLSLELVYRNFYLTHSSDCVDPCNEGQSKPRFRSNLLVHTNIHTIRTSYTCSVYMSLLCSSKYSNKQSSAEPRSVMRSNKGGYR